MTHDATVEARFHAPGFVAERAIRAMSDAGLEALLLASPENVFYTTGYTVLPSSGNPILYTLRKRLPFFSFIDMTGSVTLLCWGFSAEGVEFGADEVRAFNDFDGALRELGRLIRERSTGAVVGVESSCPLYVMALLETELGHGHTSSADGVIDSLRLIKTSAELDLIRRSTSIVEGAVSELYGAIEIGMGRLELMRLARGLLIERGATGISHITFSFGGANPEIAIDERLVGDRLVTLDLGAIYGGYCSDNRRYAYTGAIPRRLIETYETMVAIVDEVGAQLTPGITYRDLFATTLELYEQNGVKPLARFNHVGHNIGLETEEQWLDDSAGSIVSAGMAINIELYTRAESGEQVGDEETYIISEAGPERVSTLERVIREVA